MTHNSDLLLRRKWTFRAYGKQVVFVKNAKERHTHVLLKAFLWALYLPQYPSLSVEIAIPDRYQPDVIAYGDNGQILFWGEAGYVGVEKIRSLAKRYRQTHFAIAKWNSSLTPLTTLVGRAVSDLHRSAPFDLLKFPEHSAEQFIDQDGCVFLTHKDIEWTQVW